MTDTSTATRSDGTTASGARVTPQRRRRTTETKAFIKTSEFLVYVAAVAGVLVASYLVKATHNHPDYFMADKAWFYVVLLTIGYMGSRGIAKAGSHEPYDRNEPYDDRHDRR